VPLAALFQYSELFRGKRVVLVASGGNIDLSVIDRMIQKGLVSSGRLAIFEVTVDDVPEACTCSPGLLRAIGEIF